MKSAVINITVWIFLFAAIVSGWKLYFREKQNTKRLHHNITALTQEAETFRTRNGQQAARIAAQELTISELRKNKVLAGNLKNLYIPPQRAHSFTESATSFTGEFTGRTRDTFIIAPMQPIPGSLTINNDSAHGQEKNYIMIRKFEYSDPWITIKSELSPEIGKTFIYANDTIFTAIYKGRRFNPCLWIFSPRRLEVAATNTNPYINITLIQAATIKK